MAIHEIVLRENTSDVTKASAPFLGSYQAKATVSFADYLDEASDLCGLPRIQFESIIKSAFAAWEALEQDQLCRIRTEIGTIYPSLTGSFASSDAAFDSEKNKLLLVFGLDKELRNALVNVTPTIISDEIVKKVKIDNLVDVAVPRPYKHIYGQDSFRLQGQHLATGANDAWQCWVEDGNGVRYNVTIDDDVSTQLKVCHLATRPAEGFTGKIYVKSRGGVEDGIVQTVASRVDYIYKAAVVHPEKVNGAYLIEPETDLVITGTNLYNNGAVKWTLSDGTYTTQPFEYKQNPLTPQSESTVTLSNSLDMGAYASGAHLTLRGYTEDGSYAEGSLSVTWPEY